MLPDSSPLSPASLHPPVSGPFGLRELLENPAWRATQATLPIALGRSDSGEPLIADLAALPHLLVGGATGSGKSVALHSILLSLLGRAHPDDLRLVLIDPRGVEFPVYNAFPHLVVPVITQVEKVVLIVRWLMGEMRKRQRLFVRAEVHDLAHFNARPPHTDILRDDRDGLALPPRLPRLVAVIDGLSDLLESESPEREKSLAQLLEQGGPAGIHLILSSQIPGLKLIAEAMKSHRLGRLAFDTSSEADSRIFLDRSGAEGLSCNGDFVFQSVRHAELQPGQTAYVSEEEIQRVARSTQNRL